MKKFLFIFGTRPEVIKLAPLILEFKKHKVYNKTERSEGVEEGFAKLVRTDIDKIIEESSKILLKPKNKTRILNKPNPYGCGKAREKIAEAINNYYKLNKYKI